MFDAYTARKAAPRIILAVIGINLSIYLCLAAIDITNVVGQGMNQLLTQPFIDAGNYDFGIAGLNSTNGAVQNAVGAGAGYGILVSAGGLGAMFGGLMTFGAAPIATLGSLLILALPIMFTALAIMITIVIRQALLIFLTIISPVAIACYVLPGTEKYFQQWLDLFVKTLLVYPIIAVIFAMSDVFGSIIFSSAETGTGLTGFVKILTGIIVIYAPLVLIPFAFRFAGGAMGKLAGAATAGAAKVSNMGPVKGRREIAKRDLGNQMIQNRATAADRFKTYASRDSTNRVGSFAARRMANAVGGYNIEEQASARRAQTSKALNDQIATGRDEEIRGLTVNKATADRDFNANATRDADGHLVSQSGLKRVNKDGTTQYKSLGGAWVDESHVDAGRARWGRDEYAQQTALSYEMRKAATNEEVTGISQRYNDLATGTGGWGMRDAEAQGAFTGAGFEQQGTHLEFKHTNAKTGQLNYEGFAKEAYEKKGTYALSQMSGNTIAKLREAHQNGDETTKRRVEAVAESFMTRYGGGGGGAQVGEVDGKPITDQQQAAAGGAAGASASTYQTMSQGSAHVAEEVRQLAVDVGVYRPLDPATETNSARPLPNAPTDPPRPRQN